MVRSGISAGSWNTVARPAAIASAGRRGDTSTPLTRIVPVSAANTPERILTSVLLPAPLAPSKAWISPGRTRRSTDRSATTEPKLLATAAASSREGSANGMLVNCPTTLGAGPDSSPAPLSRWFQLTPRVPCKRRPGRRRRSCRDRSRRKCSSPPAGPGRTTP